MKRIGRYIIRGLLGRGGMGKVYKVELPALGKILALKLLDPDPLVAKLLGIEKLGALFETEARTMAGLNHPNIVAVHDFDRHGDKPFYVMDYFANNLGTMIGESHRIEAPSRPLAVDKTLDYIRQTLYGVGGLHDAGIYHRDIKPFNLLVTAWDTVKLCDFGLSKLHGETFAGPANLNVGSPYYAAPEQEASPDSVDQTADLYSVGVLFYRMLTGMLPRVGGDREKYRPVGRINPDLDEQWDRVLRRAIAPEPRERFADAAEMSAALDDLADHWRNQKERVCAFAPQPPAPAEADNAMCPIRKTALKVAPEEAGPLFGLDRLWRPRNYFQPDYAGERASRIVTDRATGLVWQRSGSQNCMDWPRAAAFIDHLNETGWEGRRHWRLPTVDELITLLRPTPGADQLCIAPLFDTTQRWIWSADRRTFIAAYYADIELGFIGWQDFSAPFYVRAVCDDLPS
jgi:serine/threonine-protein kinase